MEAFQVAAQVLLVHANSNKEHLVIEESLAIWHFFLSRW
jgi:hypothetical protein